MNINNDGGGIGNAGLYQQEQQRAPYTERGPYTGQLQSVADAAWKEQQLRRTCLEYAARVAFSTDVVKVAQSFYDFITSTNSERK